MSDAERPDGTDNSPNPDLRSLDTLVGTWMLSGDSEGTVT